ncbi:hypothetical protein EJ05DRAFT_57176 [Pseudovirgaria hyperparasitica]|uniref:Zn(2)-C6 fungal-type domain-containing protein n=1 Tax=Pseudovirgaria hyperparasitica TaxID=470096 RepID=A0A6A6W537_9PEZI|nr:uncharacterized protein EJ05DRAFT_57176 [Pseudovirgaria hyperparasitica]KAF2757154.1 hypothetical protein EJ05DRAFT_57176 [Pseudovirgaria hyperparasitica]
MAGPGGGPSRRSHTKSRKGCRTCKKRHIRCDEAFPQCRNCTKHQVRCDYMDSPSVSSPGGFDGTASANLLWTKEIEQTVDIWLRNGEFPFPELRVYPQPQWHSYSKTELRLIHHLCSITNEMLRNRSTKLTVWTDCLPQVISLGASHAHVMHAMLAFSASHLAWISQSSETRHLAGYYASLALRDVQQEVGNVNRSNADALLASSMLLQWVATDWRGWSTLVANSSHIMNAMQAWKNESIFADYLNDASSRYSQQYMNPNGTVVTPDTHRDHLNTLQHIHSCLRYLLAYLNHYDQERKWVEQLLGFIERLQNSTPAQALDEQFSQLYALRKWLFWVPISLLAVRRNDAMVLTVIAYFYATALALEPMFPDVGHAFCASFALQPLEAILATIATYQVENAYDAAVSAAVTCIGFPRETAASYRARRQRDNLGALHTSPSYYDPSAAQLNLAGPFDLVGSGPSLSPAAPSPLSYYGQSNPYDSRPTSIDYSGMSISSNSITNSAGYISPHLPPTAPALSYPVSQEEVAAVAAAAAYTPYPGVQLAYSGFVSTPAVWT